MSETLGIYQLAPGVLTQTGGFGLVAVGRLYASHQSVAPRRIADQAVASGHDEVPEHPREPRAAMPESRPSEGRANVGAALRVARRRRALSLEDIARTTKIRVAILRAIEANRRDQLPQPIYLRGFLRAYAREVGVEPDDTVARYFEQFEPVGAAPRTATERVDGQRGEVVASVRDAIGRGISAAAGNQWIIVTLVVVLVGLGVRRWQPRPSETLAPTASTTAASDNVSPTSGMSSRLETGTAGVLVPTATEPGVLNVEVRARASCWLSVVADGKQVVYRLMQGGEHYAFDFRQAAALRIGDPSAFEFSINGAAGRSLGPGGKAVTVRVTAENFRDLLQP